MKQLAFYFERDFCTGCHACRIACKDAYDLGPGRDRRRVTEIQGGSWEKSGDLRLPRIWAVWNSVSCCHCARPACAASCPTGALSKRASDGLVLIDEAACIGCGACAGSCPYGAVSVGPRGKAEKCDFCAELLEEGKNPVCVDSCPLRALDWGDLEELRVRRGGKPDAPGLPVSSLTGPALLVKGRDL